MGVTLVGYSLWAGYYGKKVGEEIIEEIATAEEKGKSTVLQYEPTYLHNYFNLHICQSFQCLWHQRHVPLSSFKFLQAYDKVSQIKVCW